MDPKLIRPWSKFLQGSSGSPSRESVLSRRGFLGTAGTGAVLGAGLSTPAFADKDKDKDKDKDDGKGKGKGEEDENEEEVRCAVALPIPHLTNGVLHVYFPGPIDGSIVATDGTGAHPEGRDPSTVTNFNGFVGQADLTFSGTATDTNTGGQATYQFHTDTRFMKGAFIASDQRRYEGAFAFI